MKRSLKIVLGSVLLVVVLILAGILLYHAYKSYMQKVYPMSYSELVEKDAKDNNLKLSLVYGVIKTESDFKPDAVSKAGARGLMQLMPDTFTWLQTKTGEKGKLQQDDLFDPAVNIRFGTKLLAILSAKYKSEEAVLGAYHAGIGTMDKWLSDPTVSKDGINLDRVPYQETQRYIDTVRKNRDMYKKLYNLE